MDGSQAWVRDGTVAGWTVELKVFETHHLEPAMAFLFQVTLTPPAGGAVLGVLPMSKGGYCSKRSDAIAEAIGAAQALTWRAIRKARDEFRSTDET